MYCIPSLFTQNSHCIKTFLDTYFPPKDVEAQIIKYHFKVTFLWYLTKSRNILGNSTVHVHFIHCSNNLFQKNVLRKRVWIPFLTPAFHYKNMAFLFVWLHICVYACVCKCIFTLIGVKTLEVNTESKTKVTWKYITGLIK